MLNTEFEIRSITPAIGAEIVGLDLSHEIPEKTFAEIRKTWLERKVLCFRDQVLSPQQQLGFTRLFGEIDKYPFLDGIEGNPLVAPVLKRPEDTINFGGIWHSDTAYLERPAAGATLYAREIPEVGGDTIFCNTALAYQKLSPEVRKSMEHLKAVNISSKSEVAKTRKSGNGSGNHPPPQFIAVHPVIRLHPETNERIIYVNEAHTLKIEGWNEEKSQELLTELCHHLRKPEFQCRIRWQQGTLVIWDNRSTQHYPVNDYHGFRRMMHRVSIKGDRPRGIAVSSTH